MPIVDDVLIGDGSEGGEFPHSPLPLGVYFETVISNNIKSRGDGPWMVRLQLPSANKTDSTR